jgi:hypothetical protein
MRINCWINCSWTISISPRCCAGLRGRCRAVYLREQQYAQAEAAFSRALLVVPDDPGLLYDRGLAYAEAGQIDLAVQDFQHLLKIKPGDVDASNALGFTLADANRDLPEAEKLIRSGACRQTGRSGDRRFLGLAAIPAGPSGPGRADVLARRLAGAQGRRCRRASGRSAVEAGASSRMRSGSSTKCARSTRTAAACKTP